MSALKYAKRSKLDRIVERVKSASRYELDDFVVCHLFPQVKEHRHKDMVQMIYSLRDGIIDSWDAGTALANFLEYNVITEDTLHENHN